LEYLIDAHTKHFQGDLLIHRALLTLSGVNSDNNENQTMRRLKNLVDANDNEDSPGEEKQRDIDIYNWFEQYYHRELLGIRLVLF